MAKKSVKVSTKTPEIIARDVEDTVLTTAGLRVTLVQEIDAIRRGQTTPQQGNVVAKLAGQIVATALLDLKYQNKQRGATGAEPRPVLLGTVK